MPTRTPVTATTDWTLVYDAVAEDADFSGSLAHVGGGPAIASITDTGAAPAEGAGGFVVPSRPLSVSLNKAATERLYVRGYRKPATVVLS